MKALVTGGAGFIGSNLVDRLLKLDYSVIVIDNESAVGHKNFYWNPLAKNYKLNASNYDLTRHLYDNVDWVFNVAGTARMQQSINDPTGVIKNNVNSVATVLQCSMEANVKKVIHSSTSSAYGDLTAGEDEGAAKDCLNTYSLSKAFGEDLLKVYSDLYGLNGYSVRYFNVYGPREPTEGPHATVVGKFLKQAQNSEPLTIVGDGSQTRNFTHVKDVVEANIALANLKDTTYSGELFNVAGRDNVSIQELADAISVNQTYLPARFGEHKYSKAVIDKIVSVTGWEPKHELFEWANV